MRPVSNPEFPERPTSRKGGASNTREPGLLRHADTRVSVDSGRLSTEENRIPRRICFIILRNDITYFYIFDFGLKKLDKTNNGIFTSKFTCKGNTTFISINNKDSISR